MDITKRLLELDPSLSRHVEGDWTKPYDPSDPASLGSFTSFNDAGIEVETGEFFYGLTRLLKPDHVLETGTHWGIGASYIGSALKENQKGLLETIEFLSEIHLRAYKRFQDLQLTGYINAILGDVKDFQPQHTYKLIFLDTEPQTRFAELVKFFPYLEEGGFIFIHDLHRHMHQIENQEHGFAWPYGRIPGEMNQLITSGQLRPFHFSTPRGLSGFYKVSLEDYKWPTI